jgi:dicarboxylate transporter 10
MEAAKHPSAATATGSAALAEKKTPAQDRKKPIRYPFWFGGSASSMAACVTHPLDLGTYPFSLYFPRPRRV